MLAGRGTARRAEQHHRHLVQHAPTAPGAGCGVEQRGHEEHNVKEREGHDKGAAAGLHDLRATAKTRATATEDAEARR